jgi:hypothetical protein
MKRLGFKVLFLGLLLMLLDGKVWGFCGFYVTQSDAKLFNKSSEVIIVRDGNHTVITMSSDFHGEAKDFAMVVPVPEVIQESDIRVVQQYVIDKLDAYSTPRLVEYFDPNPCVQYDYRVKTTSASEKSTRSMARMEAAQDEDKDLGVTIEAKYTVGEYDILILSAKESGGLKTWLIDNDYKLPSGAEEVLQPYINDGMKFFVVKVNLEKQKSMGFQTLRPLQIQFNSSRFMLPIRLGMANAEGNQDLVIYALTRKGRTETVNYRTTRIPTDRDIPEFIQTQNLFKTFYQSLFDRIWANEGKNSVMLEYAWDISAQQPVPCDPCATALMTFAELREAGVWWIQPDNQYGGSTYTGDLFITRLHARYGRTTFPQDLMFTNTPDQSTFQGRYVIHHAATGNLDCSEGKSYKQTLKMRRNTEMQELVALTGWSASKYSWYLGEVIVPIDPVPPIPFQNDPQIPVRAFGQNSTVPSGMIDAPTVGTPVSLIDSANPTTPKLENPAESVAASDAFLKDAAVQAKSGPNKRMWLLGIAGVMFIGGLWVRFRGRKTPQ